MNVEIGTEAVQLLFWEHINRNFFAVVLRFCALLLKTPTKNLTKFIQINNYSAVNVYRFCAASMTWTWISKRLDSSLWSRKQETENQKNIQREFNLFLENKAMEAWGWGLGGSITEYVWHWNFVFMTVQSGPTIHKLAISKDLIKPAVYTVSHVPWTRDTGSSWGEIVAHQ